MPMSATHYSFKGGCIQQRANKSYFLSLQIPNGMSGLALPCFSWWWGRIYCNASTPLNEWQWAASLVQTSQKCNSACNCKSPNFNTYKGIYFISQIHSFSAAMYNSPISLTANYARFPQLSFIVCRHFTHLQYFNYLFYKEMFLQPISQYIRNYINGNYYFPPWKQDTVLFLQRVLK